MNIIKTLKLVAGLAFAVSTASAGVTAPADPLLKELNNLSRRQVISLIVFRNIAFRNEVKTLNKKDLIDKVLADNYTRVEHVEKWRDFLNH